MKVVAKFIAVKPNVCVTPVYKTILLLWEKVPVVGLSIARD